MINLLLNIIIKNHDVYSNMCYDVHYHFVKFQLKTPPMHKGMKKTNCTRWQFEPKGIFYGKMNQTIV